MKAELPYLLIEDLKKIDGWEYLSDIALFQTSWHSDYKRNNYLFDTVKHSDLTVDLFKKLFHELKTRIDEKEYILPIDKFTESKYRGLQAKIKWLEKNAGAESTLEVKNIKEIPSIIETYFNNVPDQLPVFLINTQFGDQPFILTKVRYSNATQYHRAYTEFEFEASLVGEKITKTITIYSIGDGEKIKLSVDGLFERLEIQLMDDEAYDDFKLRVEKTEKLLEEVGTVYDTSALQKIGENRWGSNTYVNIDPKDAGISPVVVLDTKHYITKFHSSSSSSDKGKDMTVKPAFRITSIQLPVHTVVAGFHLESHSWARFEIESLVPHVFAGIELMEKLIMSDRDKSLVNMLIEESQLEMDDIISGKNGGSFILASGPPGTGKTLTAEVMAESLSLPLYTIQCSQLGLEPETIEKKLLEILQNAERWKAILQIDEADVYIRERGLDIQHNAIVGAFLRILEKARCILFMTTNISSIDDAIKSRATAVLPYFNPDFTNLMAIFNVLSEQFKVKLDFDPKVLFEDSFTRAKEKFEKINSANTDIEKIIKIEDFYEYSGRDCKSFMKLARMKMSHKKVDTLDLDDAKLLLQYIK